MCSTAAPRCPDVWISVSGAYLDYYYHCTVIVVSRYAPYSDFRGGAFLGVAHFSILECGVLVFQLYRLRYEKTGIACAIPTRAAVHSDSKDRRIQVHSGAFRCIRHVFDLFMCPKPKGKLKRQVHSVQPPIPFIKLKEDMYEKRTRRSGILTKGESA